MIINSLDDVRSITAPKSGVHLYGLFLEGASWGKDILNDPIPRVLFADIPVILIDGANDIKI